MIFAAEPSTKHTFCFTGFNVALVQNPDFHIYCAPQFRIYCVKQNSEVTQIEIIKLGRAKGMPSKMFKMCRFMSFYVYVKYPFIYSIVSNFFLADIEGANQTVHCGLIWAFAAGLGGSVGCAVRLETRRSRVQPLPRSEHSFVEIDHEIFSTVILSLPLIQEGQLSVSGERMCTILVNCLED